jgi:hypothetical protein
MLSDSASQVRQRAGETYRKTRQKAQEAYHKAGETAEDIMDAGRSAAQSGREQLNDLQSGLEDRTSSRF